MAIFYIDLVNGSDAAAGTSWGTAWKTFTSGATAARIAPGDEIRVAQTSAPTSVGTATWTSGKIGNSITFSSAPTLSIDPCKAGWVTMGAGSTVTNGQTTAYMTPVSFGGTTMGALQWTTSASANGAYKDLGSTIDYSGHQQVSFWFRTGTAFDCSGAQNLLIDLCSDAGATTVVSALTAPKWTYAANMWYPIVIDLGSALSSTVRSVRIRTTNTTSQTFYIDEMFASPAAGLTLRSLIGLDDDDWHAIRTIRGADVQLLAGANLATATGGTLYATAIDAAWMGTTQTVTTYKLEPSIALLPATGPAATFGVNCTEVGSGSAPYFYRGGWDTATGLQTGVTFIDNVTHSASSVGINTLSNPYVLIDNFGFVRFASTNSNQPQLFTKDVTVVACTAPAGNSQSNIAFAQSVANAGYTTLGWKSMSGMYNMPSYYLNGSHQPFTYVIGNCWGFVSNASGLSLFNIQRTNITIGNLYPALCNNKVFTVSPDQSNVTIGNFKTCPTAQTSHAGVIVTFGSGVNNNIKFGDVDYVPHGTAVDLGSGNVITFNSLAASGTGTVFASWGAQNVIYIKTLNSVASLVNGTANFHNNKLYFHNLNGVTDYFRAYPLDGNASPGYFELQSTDVYTAGSKAVRYYNSSGYTQGTSPGWGVTYDLKLASAAAEANKLVTVTARVKRNSANVAAGIYIPGFNEMVPGYTADITQSCSSTATYELLTITFTPTASCVFDVMAYFKPTGTVSPDIVWDALTIAQAA